jgi:hypothetical protein
MFVLIFLFIGFVFLLIKAPKAAAALIGVCVVLFVLFFFARVSSRQAVPTKTVEWTMPRPAQEASRSSIWSEGMEDQFEADLYPSKAAAAKALGGRIAEPIRRMMADPNESIQIILFQQDDDRDVVMEFGQGMEKKLPGVRHSIEAAWRKLNPGEVGVTFRFSVPPLTARYPMPKYGGRPVATLGNHSVGNGEITATASVGDKQTSNSVRFVVKPWVDDFAGFASMIPEGQFIVARSVETCTSENEARQQAMEDARQQLDRLVGAKPTTPGRPPAAVTTKDIQEGGFIADTFVQSFEGSAGKIWRQAMLIDVSAPKLAWLNTRTVHIAQVVRATWARTVLSALGVLVLILVTYFFLNMATRGYYEWSLRIAGVVLAVLAIVVFLF